MGRYDLSLGPRRTGRGAGRFRLEGSLFPSPRASRCRKPYRKANVGRSKVRSAIEHVFAAEKYCFKMFVRTVGLARAKLKIGMVNLVYDLPRLVWLEGKAASE